MSNIKTVKNIIGKTNDLERHYYEKLELFKELKRSHIEDDEIDEDFDKIIDTYRAGYNLFSNIHTQIELDYEELKENDEKLIELIINLKQKKGIKDNKVEEILDELVEDSKENYYL